MKGCVMMRSAYEAIPLVVGTAAAGGAEITNNTGLSLALFIAGLSVTAGLVWRARGERDAILNKLDRLEKIVERLECVRGDNRCQREHKEA